MDKKVAIEASLHDHISFLEDSGYEIEKIDNSVDANSIQSFDYDAVVVHEMDDSSIDEANFAGTSGRSSAPIVEAKDKTPEEVFNILRSRY